jgi:ATPase, P-type (transporting), HAD superfamily, subfamily IC
MIFTGIFGLIDPPREEAIQAVEKCKKAGIVVKMITGDHALTAMSIGKEIGIGDGILSMTGSEIEQLTDEELKEKVNRLSYLCQNHAGAQAPDRPGSAGKGNGQCHDR